MNIIIESIPIVPKVTRNKAYRCKQLELTHDDGSTAYYRILTTRNSAYAFINDILYNMNFPMASSSSRLSEYRNDPDWYFEDMENWENDSSNFDEDERTDFLSRGKWYAIDSEMSLQDAINAYRAAEYVEKLVHTNAGDAVLFNGAIFFDEKYGFWSEDSDLPNGWQDYQWKDFYGTQIEVYPVEI